MVDRQISEERQDIIGRTSNLHVQTANLDNLKMLVKIKTSMKPCSNSLTMDLQMTGQTWSYPKECGVWRQHQKD